MVERRVPDERAAPIEFWFEFGSTYSYLAALRVDQEASAAGVALVWRPFLLGPLFQRQGWSDSPYNLYPARGRYMWRDVERHCAMYGLPFRKPSVFPRNGLLAARVALLAESEPWMHDFARAVYRANFAEDREISSPEVLAEILGGMGLRSEEILAASRSPENKERLRARTDQAWSAGIFGAPSFIVDGELFWGNDRMGQAFSWRSSRTRGGVS